MKKLLIAAIAGMLTVSATGQNVVDCPYTSISSDITTNTTLSAGTLYRLEGCIHVTSGTTLTIPAGTVIMGQKSVKASLIIDSGAFLLALGAYNNPIVFTTDQANGYRNPGDWNGLIVNGKAYNNTATGKITGNAGGFCSIDGGNTNNSDSSGVLQYLRIEYAINGLTFNSVGSKTVVNDIQAAYPSVDGFQFLGGTVKARELVVLNAARTDFYFTLGNQSKLQSLLGIRLDGAANYSSAPNSNGIVFANNDDVAGSFATTIYTHPVISNATLFGPGYCGATGLSSNFKNGVLYYHRAEGGMYNSIVTGWPTGFRMEDAPTITNANTNYTLNFAYNSLRNNTTDYSSTTWSSGCASNLSDWMTAVGSCAQQGNQLSSFTLGYPSSVCDNYCSTRPSFTLGTTGLADPDYEDVSELSDAFFVPSDYRGAFDQTTDWTISWASFCPQSNVYCGSRRGMKTTGVSNTSMDNEGLNVYPNPADGLTYVAFTAAQPGTVQITVTNAVGQTVRTINSAVTQGSQKIAVNTSDLSAGVYLIKVDMANGKMSQVKLLVK